MRLLILALPLALLPACTELPVPMVADIPTVQEGERPPIGVVIFIPDDQRAKEIIAPDVFGVTLSQRPQTTR